jgi:hypothetical protein
MNISLFPANATSILQPMDMGVIYTFKSHFRRFLMQALIFNVEGADSSYALARSVSDLDAVNWIGLAVKKIKAETVKRCFAKAGFGESDVADNFEEASENIAAMSSLCRGNNFPMIQRTLFEHEHKIGETSFFVECVEEISLSCILETCNMQCNRAFI